MYAAWSRLTSVRLLLIAGTIPKSVKLPKRIIYLIADALEIRNSLIYSPQVMAHAASKSQRLTKTRRVYRECGFRMHEVPKARRLL